MSKPLHPQIRALLKKYPDGLTVRLIADHIGHHPDGVRTAINGMPDVYIDRWIKVRGQWTAIYVRADVPANCPRPDAGEQS